MELQYISHEVILLIVQCCYPCNVSHSTIPHHFSLIRLIKLTEGEWKRCIFLFQLKGSECFNTMLHTDHVVNPVSTTPSKIHQPVRNLFFICCQLPRIVKLTGLSLLTIVNRSKSYFRDEIKMYEAQFIGRDNIFPPVSALRGQTSGLMNENISCGPLKYVAYLMPLLL